ncbi:alpha-amylase family protein [Rhabdobacter roseus]|uniref:Maltose alpha-D-glucosyltransferase/alpha-amylase n=1 Tax=Rhabdobacter roseus TaxID=1655419 RepID=A0A840TZD6_9BACT|nr:alpha-amylase family protein [Rhabdobacter roseus]MBB5286897.1 maltose alpha-D-glucosyltransferase/alpha-amylase [Rhabdobacter roseus]
MKKLNCIYYYFLFLVFSSATYAQSTDQAQDMIDALWYKNSIIYNLEVGVFKDSDNDGRGDLRGLTEQLDYLKALGIDAIWLAPFQPSPGKDDGYDVADYYGVDPKYGTHGDFTEFMHQAEARGIKVIMDLVVNHTSDTHPWFQQARQSKDSRYRSWYVWSKDRPKDWNEGMVFPGVQEAVWTLDSVSGEYYYHRFYKFQPDLNYENPEVIKESRRVIAYWLQQGISGFRLDAVPFILEGAKPLKDVRDLDFTYLINMRNFTQSRKPDAVILGEANVEPNENELYFGKQGERMPMMFNFYANQFLFYALATGEANLFVEALKKTKDIPANAQWGFFLRNHDEIDLGRLSDKQRQRVYDVMGPDTSMQVYDRGIRRRLAPMLNNDRKHIELAYSLLYSLPGTPVIRYGEEIGMGDDLSLKERLSVRTPMQWSDAQHAGFSGAPETFRPVIDQGAYSYKTLNVAAQRRDPSSLLNWNARMIRLRKECPEIGRGEYKILDTGSPHVIALRYDYKGSSLVIVHNFSKEAKKARIKTALDKTTTVFDLLADQQQQEVKNGTLDLSLPGYGYKWYRVGQVMR